MLTRLPFQVMDLFNIKDRTTEFSNLWIMEIKVLELMNEIGLGFACINAY